MKTLRVELVGAKKNFSSAIKKMSEKDRIVSVLDSSDMIKALITINTHLDENGDLLPPKIRKKLYNSIEAIVDIYDDYDISITDF